MVPEGSKKHYAGQPTMLQIIIEYLTTTPPWLLMVHLFYMGMVCVFISSSYITAFHWSSLVQLYEDHEQGVQHRQFNANLKLNVATNIKINSELKKMLDDTNSMRVYIYRYHNGLPSISNVPFFFQTNTHEVISPGTPRLINFEQRIPVGIHMASSIAFVANKCIFIGNTEIDKSSQDYYFFQSRNAASLIRCPIYMENGDLFGFVGIDWNHITPSDSKIEEQLHNLAIELGKEFKEISAEN